MVVATPRIEKLIGRRIDQGRLCLVEPLGQGSGGIVFRAIDTRSPIDAPREYAVKCMFRAEEGTRHDQFQRREIHFHSTVSSQPNILTLRRILQEGRYLFLVMDYCPGGDMFKFLTERHTYCRNDELVKSVLVQLIDAVQACHNNGIFHRDIKPENIMCNADGTQLFLGDFGLSTDNKLSTNFGAGTAGYMSPECIGYSGGPEAYSPRKNDIWALGIIFTSIISGHNPWKRAVMTDDCFRAFIHDPTYLRTMLPISKAASAILQRIFVSPHRRIRLPALRAMVLAADTFFMSDEDIGRASMYVQTAAASYLGLCPSSSGSSSASDADVGGLVVRVRGIMQNQKRRTLEAEEEDVKKGGVAHSMPANLPQAHIVPLPRGTRSHPSPMALTDEVFPEVNGHGAAIRRSPVPPPKPVLVPLPATDTVEATPPATCERRKRRTWHAESPIVFFRRIMEKLS